MKHYFCPICEKELTLSIGGKMTNEGVTLFCKNQNCEAQEVFGHDRNEEKAYEIIKQKYKPS